MILYLDSSALVKCYAEESGSLDTIDLIDRADLVCTSPVTRVEVASALSRAARRVARARATVQDALDSFAAEFPSIIQVPLTDAVLVRAQTLVWEQGLRGYDAVQLSSALTFQSRARAAVTFATFDDRLGDAAASIGLEVWPPRATSPPTSRGTGRAATPSAPSRPAPS
jgi:uncharacterized protein